MILLLLMIIFKIKTVFLIKKKKNRLTLKGKKHIHSTRNNRLQHFGALTSKNCYHTLQVFVYDLLYLPLRPTYYIAGIFPHP